MKKCTAISVSIKKLIFVLSFAASIGFSLMDASGQSILLADIDESEELTWNEYSELTRANDRAYFVGRGNELWTVAPAGENADRPILLKTFYRLSELTTAGNNVYFVGDDGASGPELWRSNGTPAGTVRVKDIRPGSKGSAPASLTNVRGTMYFSADNGANGRELWKSNGTAGGTVLVRNIWPNTGSGNPTNLVEMNGLLFFAANDGTNGIELWRSNGTENGTVMIKDIRPGLRINSSPSDIVNVYGTLFFVAAEFATGRELWKSDGTTEGTVRVKDIWPGSNPSRISNTTAVYRTLYFSAADGAHGVELWKSDGTEAGTVMVKDLTPGPSGSTGYGEFTFQISNFTNIAGTLFFTAYQSGTYYMWKSNGTAAGTVPIQEVRGPGIHHPRPMFTLLNNRIFYFNRDSDSFYDPLNFFSMDRSGANHEYVTSFEQPDAYEAYYPGMALVNNTFYLTGLPDLWYGYKLLKSDGTTNGTVPLDDISTTTEGSDPAHFTLFNGRMYFRAKHSFYQQHDLWVTDGTPAGTSLFSSYDEEVGELVRIGNNLFAPAQAGFAIYKTDLTSGQTEQLVPGGGTVGIEAIAQLQNTLYFAGTQDGLWKTDGTQAGTVMVRDLQDIRYMEVAGDEILLRLLLDDGTIELWRSNGTAAGTTKVKTIKTGGSYGISNLPGVVIGNTYYFVESDGVHGQEVWKSDGTAAGTAMVVDLRTNDQEYDGEIWRLVAYENSLYISAVGPDGQWGVYKSNGTSPGTQLLKHMPRITYSVAHDGRLYLFTQETTGSNMWVSDGTPEGTNLVKEIPEYNGAFSHDIAGGVLYFAAIEGGALWRTDGTECGTFIVDGIPGGVNKMKALNNTLIFGSYDRQAGNEPHAFDLSNVAASPCGRTVAAVSETSGTKEAEFFSGYPNPFTNDITLRIDDEPRGKAQVNVFTLYGKPVETLVDLDVNTGHRLGQTWPRGVYVLQIIRKDKVTRHLVVKE